MKKKKITNPLRKRVPRELLGDWRKYFLVSLFLILTIGFVSGMYVANNSMLQSAKNGIEKYQLEDGHFVTGTKLVEDVLAEIEQDSVLIYENFYKNETEADGTVRVYVQTKNINQACLMEGAFPENAKEIAIDRMHAENVGISIGDRLTVGGQSYNVVGTVAYVNYSTLHEKNTDLMFDAIKFDVAMVTEEGFERLESPTYYGYAWKYLTAYEDEKGEKERSEEFLELLVPKLIKSGNTLKDFVPRYANSAVNFATEDMGSDKAMGGVLLNILIVIIAFIFAITINNTITREASTIGTLRALGYTKGELIRYFLFMPAMVTLFAAVIGNALGYTLFKNLVVSMYYNSYSLPTYETIWNVEAFIKTTLVPVVLMIFINLMVIGKMMCKTPLQFLRHDLKKKKRQKAMRLPKWKFIHRFRLRIIFQNASNYVVLFAGIFFIMILLAMAIGMPSTLDYYQKNTDHMMFAKYQYVLKQCKDATGNPIETQVGDAEKFLMSSLNKKGDVLTEEVAVYGIMDGSSYVQMELFSSLKEQEVYISTSYAEKYGVHIGDKISLEEKYEDQQYSFQVAGIYNQCQSIAVFMPMEHYCEVFELEPDTFTGYFSNQALNDIDEEYIATVITEREITKICDQLDHSMGAYMTYFQYLCILLSAVLIYLMTKIIIEKNETAISMTKILGYEDKEIANLYLTSTTIVVIFEAAISVILGAWVMKYVWHQILRSYNGWYAFVMEPMGYIKMFAFVLVGYFVVMFFDFKRIQKIPLEQALKHVE